MWTEEQRLFFSIMRHPAMKHFRLACRALEWSAGFDWRKIQTCAVNWKPGENCWFLSTDWYTVYSFSTPEETRPITYDDFFYDKIHRPRDVNCKCETCEWEAWERADLFEKITEFHKQKR